MDKRFIKKSSMYFIGNISSKIVNMLLIPLYAVFVSPDDLGTFDYAQTIMSIIVPLLFLSIWEASLKFLLSSSVNNIRKVLGSSVVLVISIFLFSMVSYGCYQLLTHKFDLIVFMSFLMILARSFEQIWLYYARGLHENKHFVVASIFGTISNVAFNIILLCGFKMSIYALFISYILSQFMVMILLERKLHILQYAKCMYFDIHIIKSMISFSAPLALSSASIWIMSGLGRIIVAQILGFDAAGQFAFASKFSVIPTTLGYVASMTLIEESILRADSQDADQYITKAMQNLSRIFLEIIILLMPAITMFYRILGDSKYNASIFICPWMLYYSVCMISTQNMGAVFQAKGKTKYQFLATLAGSLVMLVLSYTFAFVWKSIGVAIAQMISAIIVNLVCNIFVRKISTAKILQRELVFLSMIYSLVSYLCMYSNFLFSLVMFLVLAVIACMKERVMIIEFFELLNRKTKAISG